MNESTKLFFKMLFSGLVGFAAIIGGIWLVLGVLQHGRHFDKGTTGKALFLIIVVFPFGWRLLRRAFQLFSAFNYATSVEAKPLILAARKGDVHSVKDFLEKGYDVNERDEKGVTALMHAIDEAHHQIIQLLLNSSINIDAKDNDGFTAMNYAIVKRNANLIHDLLGRGANPYVTNEGMTYLMHAAMFGQVEIIKTFLEKGLDANARTNSGSIALILAAANNDDSILIKLLLENGADVNAVNNVGQTALMYASHHGYKQPVNTLLEFGANVNAKNKEGVTALMFAAGEGHNEIVQKLVKNGADVLVKNNEGRTARQHAKSSGHKEIANLLERLEKHLHIKDE